MLTSGPSDVKLAGTTREILEVLRRRWSVRAFADQPIEHDALFTLLEAARWAPSSFNEQPWRFVIAARADADAFESILKCLAAGNQTWAKRAAVLGVSVAKMTFDRNGRPNRHAFHDVGMAIAHLTIQAAAVGIGVHQMAGFDAECARRTLEVPEGFDPVAAFALGYPGAPEVLEDPRQRESEITPRSRLPATAIAFRGRWGAALRPAAHPLNDAMSGA